MIIGSQKTTRSAQEIAAKILNFRLARTQENPEGSRSFQSLVLETIAEIATEIDNLAKTSPIWNTSFLKLGEDVEPTREDIVNSDADLVGMRERIGELRSSGQAIRNSAELLDTLNKIAMNRPLEFGDYLRLGRTFNARESDPICFLEGLANKIGAEAGEAHELAHAPSPEMQVIMAIMAYGSGLSEEDALKQFRSNQLKNAVTLQREAQDIRNHIIPLCKKLQKALPFVDDPDPKNIAHHALLAPLHNVKRYTPYQSADPKRAGFVVHLRENAQVNMDALEKAFRGWFDRWPIEVTYERPADKADGAIILTFESQHLEQMQKLMAGIRSYTWTRRETLRRSRGWERGRAGNQGPLP